MIPPSLRDQDSHSTPHPGSDELAPLHEAIDADRARLCVQQRLLPRVSMKIIDPGYLTKREASAYTSISPRALDAAKARGDLPFYRFSSRRVLFSVNDLDRWLSKMRIAPGDRS